MGESFRLSSLSATLRGHSRFTCHGATNAQSLVAGETMAIHQGIWLMENIARKHQFRQQEFGNIALLLDIAIHQGLLVMLSV